MPNPPVPQKLFLARHGQTFWSREGRYQGHSDPNLSPEGIIESLRLAEILRHTGIGMIISSPLRRAEQTAVIVAGVLGLDRPVINYNLIEIAYGEWEGLTQADVKRRWPELLRCWKRAPETIRFPGGETLDEARLRVRECVDAYQTRVEPLPVLLVTHASWIRLALIEARGLALADFRRITVDTGTVHELDAGFLQSFPRPTEQVSCVSQ